MPRKIEDQIGITGSQGFEDVMKGPMMTEWAMDAWVRTASKGDRATYFVGENCGKAGSIATRARHHYEGGRVLLIQHRIRSLNGHATGLFAYMIHKT